MDWLAAALALPVLLLAALAAWGFSLTRHDVSIVDTLWAPMIAGAAWLYQLFAASDGARVALVLTLATLWALRLSLHIAWRNRGQGEDRRYRAMRARHAPHFARESLYRVFGLQAVLAWVVAMPLMAALASDRPLGWLDLFGVGLWLFGIAFEALADHQLARFKTDPRNRDAVMRHGLWAWSRHPNYFGECLIWWGAWLLALSAGAAWTVISPLLMTVLLLRVSGVALLERDIAQRRPGYRDYQARTSAFVPLPPRRDADDARASRP